MFENITKLMFALMGIGFNIWLVFIDWRIALCLFMMMWADKVARDL